MKRIAFVFDEGIRFPLELGNVFVLYIADEFRKKGFEVYFLVIKNKYDVKKYNIPSYVKLEVFERKKFRLFGSLVTSVAPAIFMRKMGIKYLYFDEWLFYRRSTKKLLFLLMCKLFGVFISFLVRDPAPLYEIATGYVKPGTFKCSKLFFTAVTARKFADVISVFGLTQAKVIKNESHRKGKVIQQYRGVDTEKFNPSVKDRRKELGVQGMLVIGYFGMLQEYRMLDAILRGIFTSDEIMLKESIVIVGGRGKLAEELRKMAECEFKGRLIFLGPVNYSDLPSYIKSCDLLLCPMDTVYLFTQIIANTKIFETLAVGKPIVATRTKELSLLEGRLRGVVYAEQGQEQFLEALKKAVKELDVLSVEASQQALNFGYTIQKSAQEIVEIILERSNSKFA